MIPRWYHLPATIPKSTDTAEQLVIGTAIREFEVAQIVPIPKISKL